MNDYVYQSVNVYMRSQDVGHIAAPVQVKIDNISLSKVIHSFFHQEVFGQAFFKVDTLFILEVRINNCIDFEFLFAESNSFSKFITE